MKTLFIIWHDIAAYQINAINLSLELQGTFCHGVIQHPACVTALHQIDWSFTDVLAPFSVALLFFLVGIILLLVVSLSSRALYDIINESEANGCLTFLSHEVIRCVLSVVL